MTVRVERQQAPVALAAEAARLVRHVDIVLLGAVAGLVAYGLWVLGAVSRNDVPGDPNYLVVRQGINVAIGVAVLAATALVDPELYRRIRVPLYAVMLVALAAVFVADQIRGTRRWVDIGFFQFQPSEFGKVLLVLVLATFVADRARAVDEWRTTFGAVGLAAVPAVLVFFEPDFGTALVYGAILGAVLFMAGTRWSHVAVLAGAAVGLAVSLLWVLPSAGLEILRPYQVERLTTFWNPDSDPSGATYNITQSMTAVGSGGLDGRGVAGATQTNMNYIPEHATDFIFASLAEQRGFLGAALLLLLYAVVVWRGIRIVAAAPSLLTAVIASGVVVGFVFQVFVNVGMTIGIAPITGIPLPFVSYGGSSMIATLALIGLLQAVHIRGRLAAGRR
jgi:rod shape determining protein RodA